MERDVKHLTVEEVYKKMANATPEEMPVLKKILKKKLYNLPHDMTAQRKADIAKIRDMMKRI